MLASAIGAEASARHDRRLAFEANQGQMHRDARFSARGEGYVLFATDSELVLRLAANTNGVREAIVAAGSTAAHEPDEAIVRVSFPGSRASARVAGERLLNSRSHYFRGSGPARRHANVRNFAQLRYADLYPGIDLVLYGNQRDVEYDFVVRPGAEAGSIKLRFEGSDELSIDADGDLLVGTRAGTVRHRRPMVYQDVGGERRAIDARYVLLDPAMVGFETGEYDRAAPLVIDPVVSYATYLGGTGYDGATAIAADAAGNVYVAGYTTSNDFPLKSPYDRSLGRGDRDVFVAKLDASGRSLVYSTYLGGANSRDTAAAIAVDPSGAVYVTGQTTGSDFPTTSTAYQRGSAEGGSFVTKLAASGSTLGYSTYLRGATTRAVAVDATGRAVVTGSAGAAFTTTPGAIQPATRSTGSTNAFVARLDAGGTALLFGTYLGGSATDVGTGVAVDASGVVYVAGHTTSADFPVSPGTLQSVLRGGQDGFVARLGAAGNALVYSTFLGGALEDRVYGLAVDSAGSAYVTGETYSADFPTRHAVQYEKPGRLLTNRTLGSAFVTKLAPEGDRVVYSTFFGGEVCPSLCYSSSPGGTYPGDAAFSIAVDSTGHASFTGRSRSYDMPVTAFLAPRKQLFFEESLFVAKLSAAGSGLLHSTLVRTALQVDSRETGTDLGIGNGIALDASGNTYVASTADSATTFPTTAGAFRTAIAGLEDAAIVKLQSQSLPVALMLSPSSADTRTPVTLTATVPGATGGSVSFHSGPGAWGSAPVSNGTASLTMTFPAGVRALWAIYRDAAFDGDSPAAYLAVDPSFACE